jgi:hypothetical protein
MERDAEADAEEEAETVSSSLDPQALLEEAKSE